MNKETERISVEEAARLLGMAPQGVRVQMRRGLLDIGNVFPSVSHKKGGRTIYQYFIFRNKLNRVLGKNSDGEEAGQTDESRRQESPEQSYD